jgi:SAM-dependent methyltransferase
MKKLNLGCGTDIKKEYLNMDYVKSKGVDVVHNLQKAPYPFKSGEFDEIYASHVLEHIDGDWFGIINELNRILKKGGILIVKVPHFSSAVAFIENHRRFFRYRSFESFEEQDTLIGLDQINYYKFKTKSKRLSFIKFPFIYNIPMEWFVNSSKSAALMYENTFLKSLFPAEELTFVLQKI